MDGIASASANFGRMLGHRDKWGGYFEHAYEYGAPRQRHYTNTFWHCHQSYNIDRPMQHSDDHNAHDYMQQPFVRIHDYRRGIDICNGKGSQDHVGAK